MRAFVFFCSTSVLRTPTLHHNGILQHSHLQLVPRRIKMKDIQLTQLCGGATGFGGKLFALRLVQNVLEHGVSCGVGHPFGIAPPHTYVSIKLCRLDDNIGDAQLCELDFERSSAACFPPPRLGALSPTVPLSLECLKRGASLPPTQRGRRQLARDHTEMC